jgi:plasmid stability protein
MSVVLTIRDVPEEVRDLLAAEARVHGQSLQAYLLGMLRQFAAFSGNRALIREIEADMAAGYGVDETAPDAAEVLARARAERDAGWHTQQGVAGGDRDSA